MKKVVSLIVALMIFVGSLICLSGCESKADRKYREATERQEELEREAREAEREYEDLNDKIDAYNNAREELSRSSR